ncbi:MAG: hypothetical protein J7494_12905 [Sphingobium sp.]|nr:hypothetical protein [Sphingobium sp.]
MGVSWSQYPGLRGKRAMAALAGLIDFVVAAAVIGMSLAAGFLKQESGARILLSLPLPWAEMEAA